LLADSRASELGIALPSSDLAAVILEKVRFYPTPGPTKIRTGLLRIEFSSMASDCEVRCHMEGNDLTRIVLSNFHIDAPDKAGFWLGFDEPVMKELRDLLHQPNGLYLVWSDSAGVRSDALRALSAAYPDSEAIPLVEALSDDLSFLDRAQDRRVLVGVDGTDPFFLLQTLQMFRPERRQWLRGIIFQSAIPRNCISCRQELGAPFDKAIRDQLGHDVHVMKGKGCPVCRGKGTIGDLLISSLVAFNGRLKELFVADAPVSELIQQLQEQGFFTPYEYGLRALRMGECSEEALLKGVTKPPATYAVREIPNAPKPVEQAEEPRPSESGRFILSDEFFSGGAEDQGTEEPLRGASVFQTSARGSAPRMAAPPPPPQAMVKGAGDRILVIDDDPDQRAILSKVFEMAGYTVSCAADGIDGIVSAANQNPAVIIVDLMMPDIDGRETIRRLRHNPMTKRVPIIALTAYPDPEVEYDLLDAGADDFCPKSVSKKVLLKRIERLRPSRP